MTNPETADPTAAIEVFARLLCTADIHVYGDEHRTWQKLSRKVQDDYRKAARWLLPRMTVATRAAAVSVPPPAPRADAWLDAAAYLETLDPAEAALSGQYAWHNAAAHLRRKAGEDLFAVTPCSPIVGCEPGGEPCDTHERLLGHIEGDHELCGPECSGPCVAGEQQNAAALYPHTMLGAAELEEKPDLNVTRLTGEALNAGEQQNETPEAEAGCAHCGKNILRISGTLAEWWVHDPGGHTICFPEQAASSPRATPKPAAGVRQDGAQP